jgi:pimeloyl-ACP methyl ester carboxylesterase
MADDTAGLIDALELDSAHLVGASLGGMVAQTTAVRHPDRVRSLTSIMSTTGRPDLLRPTPEASAILLQPAPRTRDEAMDRAVEAARVLGSPGFELDEAAVREQAGAAWDRANDPPGFARQLAAVHRSGDRTEAIRSLRLPTLVLHGEDDPLIPIAAGHGTAEAIDGAELVTYPGMGHDLPRALWPDFVERISALVARAEHAAATA